MKKKINICHLTSVHTRYDIRIFIKECSSLAKVDEFQVALIVADGKGEEIKNNVNILDVGKSKGRINRFLKTTRKIYQKAKKIDYDIYHIHDPELILVGLKLKKNGKKVIFDAHEDFPKQIKAKPYLNIFLKKILPYFFELFENLTLKKYNYIVTATPYINDKFLTINKSTLNINNYPIIGELSSIKEWEERENTVSYLGGISIIRGIVELIKSLALIKTITKLNLVGEFSDASLELECKAMIGFNKVNEHGFLNREEVANVLSTTKIGVVTFLPLPNHIDSQPNKMFEYISAGIPIITSNFPLWKDIVEGNNCGITVDPNSPIEIANAIDYLIENEDIAKVMGENGKKAVMEKYNWSIEEKKLIKLYKLL